MEKEFWMLLYPELVFNDDVLIIRNGTIDRFDKMIANDRNIPILRL